MLLWLIFGFLSFGGLALGLNDNATSAAIWAHLNSRGADAVYVFQFVSGGESEWNGSIPGKMVAGSSTEDQILSTGWITQSITTSDEFDDKIQAYWAGFLETNQTFLATQAHYNNSIKWLCDPPSKCQKLGDWLRINLQFMITSAEERGKEDAFWHQVHLMLWQAKGMIDAYGKKFVNNSQVLSNQYLATMADEILGIYLLSISADLGDIMEALEGANDERVVRLRAMRPSCSALIKIVGKNEDIYTAHDTWGGYEMMIRVAKLYNLPWLQTASSKQKIPGAVISMSSYPSTWNSIDDYYLIESGLTTIETTNNVYNSSLYHFVKEGADSSVLEVFRVMAANRLATDVKVWVDIFSPLNSGTYNNQWMILDRKQFTPNAELPKKRLFMVVEQMPGNIVAEDMSEVLAKNGYWASYNLAYFQEIKDYGGQTEEEKNHGALFSHDLCPRALIFARDQGKIRDLKAMYQMMRYNEFDVDPLSDCACRPPYSAQLAIAARGDLNTPEGTFPFQFLAYRVHGAIDTKLSNHTMSKALSFIGVSSPTYETVPEFKWSRLAIPHELPSMHPDKWMFPPIQFQPDLKTSKIHMESAAYLSRRQAELEQQMLGVL